MLGSGRVPGLGVTGCGLGPDQPSHFLWAASISPSVPQGISDTVHSCLEWPSWSR